MPGDLGANFERDQKQELPVITTKGHCRGGSFIVTGSNTGLSYEAAKYFVQLSAAKVIIAVRSTVKGEEAKAKIEAVTGVKNNAEVWPLDMASYSSIKVFADRVTGLDRLDAIIENAGAALAQWSISDGLETTIIVNVTGTLLLAELIMPKLQESAKKLGIMPHISIVGRTAEMGSRTLLHGAFGGKETHNTFLSECEIKE
jgi:NAD(P)-dependent dehydrogenase (short-subunit alcohol dehydrogenase family)